MFRNAIIVGFLCIPLLSLVALAQEPIGFGMDVHSIDVQTSAGIKPDYGLLWVGIWNLETGWGGTDTLLKKAYDSGVTPVIQFYYWGDDISRACLEQGCESRQHDGRKDRAGWDRLARELVDSLNREMNGRPVVIVLETEFNKNDVAAYEPLDGYLEEKARYFKRNYPNAQIVLGLGNWGREDWSAWDRAARASDYIGLQALRGSTRDSLAKYQGFSSQILDGANAVRSIFNKPIFYSDVALSSYPEPQYAEHQATAVKGLFERMPEMREAGISAFIYRSWKDVKADTSNYYGEAERHFGLARSDGTAKPALSAWIEGVKIERGSAPARETAQAAGGNVGVWIEVMAFLVLMPFMLFFVYMSKGKWEMLLLQNYRQPAPYIPHVEVRDVLAEGPPQNATVEMLEEYARRYRHCGRHLLKETLVKRDGFHEHHVHEALDRVFGRWIFRRL